MRFRERKPETARLGSPQHEVDVLGMLRQPRHRAEIALDHLLGLAVHDAGIGRARLENGRRARRIEPERLRKGQSLGEGGPVETEHEIGDELHAGGVATATDGHDGAAESCEDVVAFAERFLIAADHGECFAAAELFAASGNGGFEVRSPSCLHGFRAAHGSFGFPGARVHNDRAPPQFIPHFTNHLTNHMRIRQTQHNPPARTRHSPRIGCRLRSTARQSLGIAIPCEDAEAGRPQPLGNRRAHQASADQADWLSFR